MNIENNNAPVQKGNIYFVMDGNTKQTGNEIWSNRPGIIVSNDISNKHSGVVSIVYLTTSKRKRIRPSHIPVISGGLQALALCEQIFTIDASRLSDYIGTVNEEAMENIDTAIMFQLGINPALRPTTIFKKWENYIIRNGMNLDEYHPEEKQDPCAQNKTGYISILTAEIKVLQDEVDKYKKLYADTKNLVHN